METTETTAFFDRVSALGGKPFTLLPVFVPMNGCSPRFLKREAFHFAAAMGLLVTMFLVAYRWPVTVAVAIGGMGLVVHELAHKVVGSYRCVNSVNFQIHPAGIVVGFLSSIFLGHTITTPGGVNVGRNATSRDQLYMALAGPLSNILLFGIGLALHEIAPWNVTLTTGVTVPVMLAFAYVNLWLGVFNLIPIPGFDGMHVLRNGKVAWGMTFFVSLVILVVTYGEVMDVAIPLFQATTGGFFGVGVDILEKGVIPPLIVGTVIFTTTEVKLWRMLSTSVADNEVMTLGSN